jgi:hypothetical protein
MFLHTAKPSMPGINTPGSPRQKRVLRFKRGQGLFAAAHIHHIVNGPLRLMTTKSDRRSLSEQLRFILFILSIYA